MSDATELTQYVSCLARHIEQGEELARHCEELLSRTQNAETCDVQPPPKLWEECRDIVKASSEAVRLCRRRSSNLRWDPGTTSRE